MDPLLALHNTHVDGLDAFWDRDPQLRGLERQAVVYESPLLDELPTQTPGIYTLGGARQIGKTTLLKQWMARRLAQGTEPERICFLTGELLDDHHALVRCVEEIDGVPVVPVPQVLVRLAAGTWPLSSGP